MKKVPPAPSSKTANENKKRTPERLQKLPALFVADGEKIPVVDNLSTTELKKNASS